MDKNYNFRNRLQELNEEYINHGYEKWVKEKKKELKKIRESMLDKASDGYDYIDIMLLCDKAKNDEKYYIKYFTFDLGLDVKTTFKIRDDVQEYKQLFSVSWKDKKK